MIAAISILVLTLGLALRRPVIWGRRVEPAAAAMLGALLMIALGILTPGATWAVARRIAVPVATLLSLMTVAMVFDSSGLLGRMGDTIARRACGDGRRLFRLVFLTTAAFGMVLDNDTAILLFTPLVLGLVTRLAPSDWPVARRMPYLFAVLYAGNLAGAFPISNPVNLVVAHIFEIDFAVYSVWMFLPTVASLLVTGIGLEIAFRHELRDARFATVALTQPVDWPPVVGGATCLAAILAGLLAGEQLGPWGGVLPPVAATFLLVGLALTGRKALPLVARLNWSLAPFLFGIFVIAAGFRAAGLTEWVAAGLGGIGESSFVTMILATGFGAALCSALINNHPTAGIASWVIQDLSLTEGATRTLVLAALIGSDLGPKMLPLGSLAAILWMGLLRERGVDVSPGLYVRVGIPVTLPAIAASLAVLILEHLLFAG